MFIAIEFVGTLRTLANTGKYRVELGEKTTISTLIHKLNADFSADKGFPDESNLLILINGKEISVLNDLQTELRNNDTVILVPISHGG